MARLSGAFALVAGLALGVGACDATGTGPAEPDPTTAWTSAERTSESSSTIIERVRYDSDGLSVTGQVCRPNRPGSFPPVLINHGGWTGLQDAWNDPGGLCGELAADGFVVLMSSYRGEDGSEGRVELCLGEVSDVLNMLQAGRQASYVDDELAVMVGVSHGGCIALRALQERPDLFRGVASLFAPTDWTRIHEQARVLLEAGIGEPYRSFFEGLLVQMEVSIGGSPAEVPQRFAERSPAAFSLGGSTPLLLQYGAEDLVVPPYHGCLFAERSASDVVPVHVDGRGDASSDAPEDCAAFSLAWASGPRPDQDLPSAPLLNVYEGVNHDFGANISLVYDDLVWFFSQFGS